jgi:polysaccharide deacetylase 2 family uncharacterized protein YibQ
MQGLRKYKLAILLLSIAVILQWIFIARKQKPAIIPTVTKGVTGKIAIVIDDWGYNLDTIEFVTHIHAPLTVSVLPNLPYSREIAHRLEALGFEVMLHLPMEPHEKFRLEQNTIMSAMSAAEIRALIARALENVSQAKGVNNHMGSAATENIATMTSVLEEVKSRKLFFLDSMVTSKSVCSGLARKLHIPFTERDIFLDNKDDPGYIRQQLLRLKKKARMTGSAVGIGHDRKATLQAIKESIPLFEKEGLKFVFVSELVDERM